jgi:putative alpha-1,2-mannosidase
VDIDCSSHVDPFIGTAPFDLPPGGDLASRWWLPKPPIGNTHPGACFPFGMVSACPYSGAYPTGYGRYGRSTEGPPAALFERLQASGFAHFQQSGTGAIRKYYNYFRVTPLVSGIERLGESWELTGEVATPGYYAARMNEVGIGVELTVGPKLSVHRYTFPPGADIKLAVDFSCGGLALERARTVPTRADLELTGEGCAQGTVVMEGVPLSAFIRVGWPCAQAIWYDRRIVGGGTRLVLDRIRETTLLPFGVVFSGRAPADGVVEIALGFSLRGVEQARSNAQGGAAAGFHEVRHRTARTWEGHLSRVKVEGGEPARLQTFYTALYHSLIKPCFAADESPFWRHSGPFVFDICTMWDIYKTQLPLIAALDPHRATQLLECLIRVSEEEGNFPIGYRMARGSDRFFRQASALAHTALADAHAVGLRGIDWEWALGHMHGDLSRTYGEEFLDKGRVQPLTHTLDLAYGCHCTARVARALGDVALADRMDQHATGWVNAYDPSTGLLADSTYYEGSRHNYSFRLLHDMAQRIQLSGGDAGFVSQLDRFFGFGAEPVVQLGQPPFGDALEKGYALGRFEGLNNEPDMEAPYAYHYAGRPDRTARVVREALDHQFGPGRGGLPGNDDSGGLSSWYVWSSIGLFPVAGQSVFLINVPAFERVEMSAFGAHLEIVVRGRNARRRNTADKSQFVHSVTLNGENLDRSFLTASELAQGGTLTVVVADEPSAWGQSARPPSVTPFPPRG